MKETYVVWKNTMGERNYTPFKNKNLAYNFMLEKLSCGLWACIPKKITIHKCESSDFRR
tara:strand:+ start:40 stop:216 length:177 start_codon:yes stop_codon:yes gene_type:complete